MRKTLTRAPLLNLYLNPGDVLEPGTRRFEARIPRAGHPDPATTLVDARVRLVGSAIAAFNARGELLYPRVVVMDPADMQVVEPPPCPPFAVREVPVANIATVSRTAHGAHRLRTRGTVNYVFPGGFYLQAGPAGIRVETADATLVAVNDRVEVTGFLDRRGHAAGLHHALVRVVSRGTADDPLAIAPADVARRRHHRQGPGGRGVARFRTRRRHPQAHRRRQRSVMAGGQATAQVLRDAGEVETVLYFRPLFNGSRRGEAEMRLMTPDHPTTSAIRILIVDDHPVFRAGLANLLSAERGFTIVGRAANGADALDLFGRQRPHVVLLDLSMPGLDGLETMRRMLAIDNMARIVVLTSSDAPDDIGRAVRSGAHGYLTKLADRDEIVAAIRDVHAGKRRLQAGLRVPDTAPALEPHGLSPRGIEVLMFVRYGYSNAEIVRRLGITERTVKAHVALLLEKLGAADRAGAVARGFDLGILKAAPPPP